MKVRPKNQERKLYRVMLVLLITMVTSFTSLFLVMKSFAAECQTLVDMQENSYFVAPYGDDENPGSLEKPWASLQHAANTLSAGETVYARAGIYKEIVVINVSGYESGGYITFRNYPGEVPVLDGEGLYDPNDITAIHIRDHSYLVISGFEIRKYISSERDNVPVGIRVGGASHHIKILDNYIHLIETQFPVGEDLSGANAHGLIVSGNNENQPIQHLTIAGNEISDLKLGSSEAMVLNGNVEFFTVTNNMVHDVDNIGISLIGFEGKVSDPELDRARYGVVSDNIVYNVDSATNPSYGGGLLGGGDQSAAGIYVDGGRDIVIARNRIFECNFGLEIASENSNGNVQNITAHNNFIYYNHLTGLAIGGYKIGLGYADNCAIVNNTLYHNDRLRSGTGELVVRYETRGSVIENNIIYTNEQNIFIHNRFTEIYGNQIDNNLYYCQDGAEESVWRWKDIYYKGFEIYRAASGNDQHSLFAKPGFEDLVEPDLHLQVNSVAIGAGKESQWIGDLDIDSEARVQGESVDIGADEWDLSIFLPLVIK